MKTTIVLIALLGLTFTSCKKEGNKGVLKQDSIKMGEMENPALFDQSKTYTYIAEDGSRANVSYQNEQNDHTLTIKANNTKYVLDKKDADAGSEIYQRNGVEAKVTKDSLKITQDNMVISMGLTNN